MDIVCFDRSGSTPAFEYKLNGSSEFIDFLPPIDDLDSDIQVNDYVVELLINPMLSNESDIYSLCMIRNDDSTKKQSIGAIFPVSALDSDQQLRKGLCDYLYVAFWHLLDRLKSIKAGDFSSNFESNVCVVVFSKRLVGTDNPLHMCIHSLRKYGYSYFEAFNKVVPIEGYSRDIIIQPSQKNIVVEVSEPILYGHPIIDRILRDLKSANNVTHRFVLLYQVVELLMEDAISQDVVRIYNMLQRHVISTNDYFEKVSRVSRERARVTTIFDLCTINANDCKKFRDSCRTLFTLAGFIDDFTTNDSDLFYNFRNKMTHSYRALYAHKASLSETIQHFELIVLLIIERYPRLIAG